MTSASGDPRTYAPDLFASLSRFEQRFVESVFEDNLAQYEADVVGYRPSESADQTARRAFTDGVGVAGSRLTRLAGLPLGIGVAILLSGGSVVVGLLVAALGVPVVLGIRSRTASKVRMGDTYFSSGAPEARPRPLPTEDF